MDKYAIDKCLERLRREGEALGAEESIDQIKGWIATVIATVSLFLPDGSAIIKTLEELREANTTKKGSVALNQALRLLQIATEFNRNRQDDQTMATLRTDLRAVMAETLVKSPWFHIPTAILLAAVGFTFFGVLQIRDYKLDLQTEIQTAKTRIDDQLKAVEATIDSTGKRAKASAEEAKQAVEKDLKSQLETYLAAAKTRINDGAEQHLESLKRTHTPALESGLSTLQKNAADLDVKLKQLQHEVAFLEQRADELSEGLKQLDLAAGTGVFNRLSIFLSRSRRYVLAEVILAGTASFLSLVALIWSWLLWRRVRALR